MKRFVLGFFLLGMLQAQAQPKLEKLWEILRYKEVK